MTSRRLFFKMMREDIRRRLWAVALVILSWFFVFPVRVALIPGEYRLEEALYQQKIIERTEHWFSIGNVWGMFVIILGAVILGISSFSYLHSKKKVDFYHSIPVRREVLFLVNFWDGVWIMAIPYLLSMVCAAAIGASFGVSFSTLIVLTGKAWIFHMIYFLLLYSTTVVAMMMTGNLYLGILGVLVFYFYIPAVGLLAEELHACFFKTYAGQAFWAWKLMDFSPCHGICKSSRKYRYGKTGGNANREYDEHVFDFHRFDGDWNLSLSETSIGGSRKGNGVSHIQDSYKDFVSHTDDPLWYAVFLQFEREYGMGVFWTGVWMSDLPQCD